VRAAAMVDEPRQPEVAELGVEGGVQHDIAGFDVPVQYTLFAVLM